MIWFKLTPFEQITTLGQNQPYNGDILIGPFIPFGIESDDQSFFEKANHEFKKKSQDLTFQGVQSILENISKFKNLGSKIKIRFLPLDTSTNFWKKSRFQQAFDFVLISNFASHHIKLELTKLVKENGVILVDNTRWGLYHDKISNSNN